MFSRLLGFFALIVAFVLTAQLRGSYLLNPSPRTTLIMALILGGVALLAAVVSGGVMAKRRKRWRPPQTGENQRGTFRIVYPRGDRPQLVAGRHNGNTQTFEVLDLSEEGVRFDDQGQTLEEDEIAGELLFTDGRRAQVAGTVVRRDGHQICVHLTSTVPPNLVVEEQLRLRNRPRDIKEEPGA